MLKCRLTFNSVTNGTSFVNKSETQRMKKILFSIAIAISLVSFQSCKDDKKEKASDEISANLVPASVKTAFSAKYSTATNVIWEDAHEDDTKTYKAKFTLGDKKMKAEFDANGALVKEKEDD